MKTGGNCLKSLILLRHCERSEAIPERGQEIASALRPRNDEEKGR